MARMFFLNLPVRDLARSTAFYEAVGAEKDERFCDGTASGVSFSDEIKVMLLTHEKFAGFSPRPIADAKATTQALFCLSAESRDDVDAMIGRATKAGGVADPSAKQDYGFMYCRSFEDPDGHLWEVAWMDVAAFEAAQAETAA